MVQYCLYYPDPEDASEITTDYNCYWATGDAEIANIGGVECDTIEEVRNAWDLVGKPYNDANSIVSDPELTSGLIPQNELVIKGAEINTAGFPTTQGAFQVSYYINTELDECYNKTVSTKRLVTTIDSGRKPISTFNDYITSVNCRIQQYKGQEPTQGGRKFSTIKHVIYCSYELDIIMSDLVTYKGVDYEIVGQMFENNENTYQKLLLAKSERN